MKGKNKDNKRDSIAMRVNRRRKARQSLQKEQEEQEDPELAQMFNEDQEEDQIIPSIVENNPP